ncbi:hypothetical protein OUZ56_023846 [Daphnia magna]|uniref:Uncharacterized protein n=1 Tax=Daphnia magna TaxID=35525 RepID=A0ABR0B0B7_9CRUS|nr:hypothetical protein OUZ56_023846 [Daphnia magna]
MCGPMDKAPAYGAGDSRFDPWHVQEALFSDVVAAVASLAIGVFSLNPFDEVTLKETTKEKLGTTAFLKNIGKAVLNTLSPKQFKRTPKVGETKSEGQDNSESEDHQTSSSETEYKTDEEVPREDEQAADDTHWENSKRKALRRTPPPTERLYPHLSEVEENEVVESKS